MLGSFATTVLVSCCTGCDVPTAAVAIGCDLLDLEGEHKSPGGLGTVSVLDCFLGGSAKGTVS